MRKRFFRCMPHGSALTQSRFCIIGYVREMSKRPNNFWNRFTRGSSPNTWNIAFRRVNALLYAYLIWHNIPDFMSCFLLALTPTSTVNRFARPMAQKTPSSGKKCILGDIPAIRFLTVRDKPRQQHPTEHRWKLSQLSSIYMLSMTSGHDACYCVNA